MYTGRTHVTEPISSFGNPYVTENLSRSEPGVSPDPKPYTTKLSKVPTYEFYLSGHLYLARYLITA